MTCEKTAKVMIGVTNGLMLLIVLVGSIVVYVHYDKAAWSDVEDLKVPAIFLLVVAAVTIISAIIGLCAICRTRKGCTVAYLAIILLVIAVEIVGIAIAYLYSPKIVEKIEENWEGASWRKEIEKEFECCGWTEPTLESDCGAKTFTTKLCKEAITESAHKWVVGIAVGVIILAIIEVLLLVSTIYLLCFKADSDPEGVQPF
jgi:hypothetical protein